MKRRAKDIAKLLLVIPVTGIAYLSELIIHFSGNKITQRDDLSFEESFLCRVFGGLEKKEDATLRVALFALAIPMIFNILYGAYIYKDLQQNSLYYFARFRSRARWFRGSVARLLLSAVWYCFFWVLFAYLLSLADTDTTCTPENVRLFLVCLLTVIAYTVITTLIINSLSFYLGSAISFILVYLLVIGLFYLCFTPQQITFLGIQADLSKFNILMITILNWKQEIDFSGLYVSAVYSVLLLLALSRITARTDVGLQDKESY